ncbi:MAG: D-alanyl-D-alanine carboxypeptidase/D-alanyl-D-alanine-endopeptidase [Bacteroidota bacterium]
MRLFLCSLTLILGCLPSVHARQAPLSSDALNERFTELIDQGYAGEAFWGISVRDEEGNELFSKNGNKLFRPASNVKLFTSAAVLNRFGVDYTFKTIVYGAGALKDGVWMGDIIIRGAGDPSINGVGYDDDRWYVFKQFVHQLKKAGIQSVEGKLIANLSLFDDRYYPKGWDVDDLSFYYGVQTSPLSFNSNTVDLIVEANGEVGEVPDIRWFPDNTDYVTFINEQQITGPGTGYEEYYHRNLGTNTINLGSTMPVGYVEKESLSIHDPGLFFVDSFAKFLSKNGISVSDGIGTNYSERDWQSLQTLAVHTSAPVSELLIWANKESDNLYFEMFTKAMAAFQKGSGASTEQGIQMIKAEVASLGLDTSLVHLQDGSGLSGGNLTTPSNFTLLLSEMTHHPSFSAFYKSLPVSQMDGTLAWRFKRSEVGNRFSGKTGFMGGVRTLSGYLDTASGKRLAVSIMTNNFVSELKEVDRIHEQWIEYLYTYYGN